jgi:uncharacterized membrane protein YhaH (DUF805 family)
MNWNFKDWISPEGELKREDYIVRALAGTVGAFILTFLLPFGFLIGLLGLVITVFAVKRRFETLGQSPWWTLLLLVPLVGLVMVVGLMFKGD